MAMKGPFDLWTVLFVVSSLALAYFLYYGAFGEAAAGWAIFVGIAFVLNAIVWFWRRKGLRSIRKWFEEDKG